MYLVELVILMFFDIAKYFFLNETPLLLHRTIVFVMVIICFQFEGKCSKFIISSDSVKIVIIFFMMETSKDYSMG